MKIRGKIGFCPIFLGKVRPPSRAPALVHTIYGAFASSHAHTTNFRTNLSLQFGKKKLWLSLTESDVTHPIYGVTKEFKKIIQT